MLQTVEPIEDFHIAVVTFPDRVIASTTVTMGADAAVSLPISARTVTRCTWSGTMDHPVRAELVGCGDQVDLIFDPLRVAASVPRWLIAPRRGTMHP